jgi:hypothetical protein
VQNNFAFWAAPNKQGHLSYRTLPHCFPSNAFSWAGFEQSDLKGVKQTKSGSRNLPWIAGHNPNLISQKIVAFSKQECPAPLSYQLLLGPRLFQSYHTSIAR